MNNSLKIGVFVLVVVGAIAGFAALIPQLESPAPESLEITGELSGPELAALGETVLQSPEAGCLACHGLGREGLRAPDLAGIGARANQEYIRESIVNPCAAVVEGYDCIMPQTLLQTLGPAKVTALVAFLQSQGGEITVTLSAEEAAGGGGAGSGTAGVAGTTPDEIVKAAGCNACHTISALPDVTGQVGPDLSQVGARLTPDEIRQSVLTPDAVVAAECPTGACPPGVMPKDFGDRLSAGQLETLVAFLSNLE